MHLVKHLGPYDPRPPVRMTWGIKASGSEEPNQFSMRMEEVALEWTPSLRDEDGLREEGAAEG